MAKKVVTQAKESSKAAASTTESNDIPSALVFGRMNYILMIAGLVIITLGFFLMTGSANNDPATFNPDIFSSKRITVAPIVITIGFIVEIVAIMWRPRAQ